MLLQVVILVFLFQFSCTGYNHLAAHAVKIKETNYQTRYECGMTRENGLKINHLCTRVLS